MIWSIDAFERVTEVRRSVVQLLGGLVERTGAEVRPVHVFSPAELSLSIDFKPPWTEQVLPKVKDRLRAITEAARIPGIGTSAVLIQGSSSTRKAVEKLTGYAKDRKADLIVAGTHGRSGVRRWLLGSFAETLILRSKVPVLITGPSRMASRDVFDRVLFPTDLSPQATEPFHYVVALCAQLKASLFLFHAIPNPIEPVIQEGMFLFGGSWVPVRDVYKEDLEARQKQLEEWAAWSRKQGVPTEPALYDGGGSTSAAIIRYARRQKLGLIAMAAQSGAVSATLIGSITRQVVRNSHTPVWIIHA